MPIPERARRLEIAALALLAVVPIVPYLASVLARGVARFDLVADLAQMEYCTRRVWTGDTLLGLASRFRWSHPGPLLFYVLAPFEKLWGRSSTGMYVGTCVVSMAAAATPVALTRAFASRAHAIAVLVVVLAWLAAFGNVAGNPWVRVVVGLPLVAYLVLCVLFARGASAAFAPAVFFGAIAAETHVSTVPTVGLVGAVALGGFLFRATKRGGLARREKRDLAIAIAVLVLALLPPIVEEARGGSQGNFSLLVRFFRHRSEPYKPLGDAAKDWLLATSWMPDRVLSLSLPDDTGIPFAMRWDPVSARPSWTACAIGCVYVGASLGATWLARRRRDDASLALVGYSAIGNILAVIAIRAIVGEEHYSLLFWTTASSSLGWMGIVASFGGALADLVDRARPRPRLLGAFARLPLAHATTGLAIGGLAIALGAAALQRAWMAKYPHAVASDPWRAEARRNVYELLRKEHAIPVLHLEGGWGVTMTMLLEADKDGVDFRVADRDLWAFPGARGAREGELVRHIWFSEPTLAPPMAACLERLQTFDAITVLASPIDRTSCRD